MSSPTEKAVIKTLAYADIFDWPLKKEEIWEWLIKFKVHPDSIGTKFKIQSSKLIKKKGGFFFLKDRENIVRLRKLREKWSKEKIKIARQIVPFLKLIPTVRLVGITGALAINNAKENDDIDLFIITSSGLLWTTRLLVTLMADILGKRRHPYEREVNNKICLNMFMDEDHLTVPKEEQDLFSAHEIVQMKPLYDKGKTDQKFLTANQWTEKFLPNSLETKNNKHKAINKKSIVHRPSAIVRLLEEVSKRFQLWYMRNRRSKEVIREGVIRFHPQDARKWILKKYKEKLLQDSP